MELCLNNFIQLMFSVITSRRFKKQLAHYIARISTFPISSYCLTLDYSCSSSEPCFDVKILHLLLYDLLSWPLNWDCNFHVTYSGRQRSTILVQRWWVLTNLAISTMRNLEKLNMVSAAFHWLTHQMRYSLLPLTFW